MSFQVKVSTQALRSKSAVVTGKIAEMRNTLESASTLIGQTGSYWIGDAGDKRRREYTQKNAKLVRMMNRLNKYPRDLLLMAGIYEQTEHQNTGVPGMLPVNVIE